MLNGQEALELERAMARAAKEGTRIIGRGTRKSDGARVFVVSSSRDQFRGYIVVVHASHLACECPSRKVCKHRALVHLALKKERDAAQAAKDRDTAPLYRSNAPFSLFK
ncbi:MAG: hypothetical protein IVW57_14045 [Ktedonobacterales bacterium]|nr:hypothetical protein [Ktedonobacterales bacterium]